MASAPALLCAFLISVSAPPVSAQEQRESAPVRLLASFGLKHKLSCTSAHQNSIQTVQWLQKTSSMERWEEIAELSVPVNKERFQVLDDGSLVILSVGVEDEGLFKCRVGKDSTEDLSVTSVLVYKSPSEPVLKERFLTFTAGALSEIGTCISDDGHPISNIIWYKDGKEVVANGNEAQVEVHIIKNQNTQLYTTESTLSYTLTKKDVSAAFECLVVSPSQGGCVVQRSRSIWVDVHYAIENVEIEVEPSDELIDEGGSITLKCRADTNPPPIEYLWEKDGKLLGTLDQYTIQAVSKRDEGSYQCTVFDFNFNQRSALKEIRVKARENNNALDGEGRGNSIFTAGSHSKDGHGGPGTLNRAGMVIGIIVTLSLVAFFISVAYYICYHRQKKEKKRLEDFEETRAMDPEKAPPTAETLEGEVGQLRQDSPGFNC
ncbi:advanced glycosylation end product-specific receptor isoform X1 [Amblyraja radiata]|uniref:advanced glycosylation end product-specific receptor isoform X1 n=1 Tax=Amblyraja radiata TaxID=386614 RepID=UPI0014023BB2|nr:advanced glycosylation end product-specific receptor isoform X1 [Amblyraja radiata]